LHFRSQASAGSAACRTRFPRLQGVPHQPGQGLQGAPCGPDERPDKDQLSKATLCATLTALKRFFIWLAGQPGYKSRISYSNAEYINLSAKETRVAKAHREARVPTLEQIEHVIRTMPAGTEIERRDRALVAFRS
jgi:hypothetical protein